MGQLSELQARVLVALAGLQPPWTLTGGAALAGFHLQHRTTRDLDLFWHDRTSIAELRREAVAKLRGVGFQVLEQRSLDTFSSLLVTEGPESVVVDLVADPVDPVEKALSTEFRGVRILVDTPHEILVNKLCSLVHRSELRDLVDVEALLARGGNLERALSDAPSKDGGFSALTLGWVLSRWDVAEVSREAGMAERATALESFRDELLRRSADRDS